MNILTLNNINYDIENDSFVRNVPLPDFVRYLKGVYSNKQKLQKNFIDYFVLGVEMCGRPDRISNIELILYYYDKVKPFSYEEAFKISDNTFKAMVFGSINISEMIQYLGNERIEVKGKPCTHRVYNLDGSYTMKTNDLIYELHKINLNNLGSNDYAYAVKCWCTTTNKEHWLWVDEKYAVKGVLEAIASTCMVYENMIPHIKTLKRQGDIFIFEMKNKCIPSGNIIPLNANQYFDLLVAQS